MITALMAFLMAGLIYFVQKSYPDSIKGLREWAWAGTLSFISAVLYTTQGSWSHWVSMALPGVLMVSAGVMQLKGTFAHFGQRLHRLALWGPILLTAAGMLLLSGREGYFAHRVTLIVGITGLLFAAQLNIYWRNREGSFAAKLNFGVLALLSLNTLFRVVMVIALPQEADTNIFAPTLPHVIYLACYSFGGLLLGMGEILLAAEKMSAELRQLVKFDALTGALTRRAALEFAESELARSARLSTDFSVIMLDLDHFKQVNDRFGHQMGDRVLIDFVKHMQQALRRPAVAGRYGGEEFIILLPDTGLAQALQVAQRVRHRPSRDKDLPVVTVSLGVATFRHQASDHLEALIGRADDALYRAKAAGRDRIELSEPCQA